MTMSIAWLVFALVILLISSLAGLHLGRFREAYTEMTGMMAGMTMGMLNGFLLGFAAAAATGHKMFWGNLFGILMGLLLGVYFGRAGGLMGIMDGGMGGVMGGSMGAMLDVMLQFPPEGVYWTALLLSVIYLAGMVSLVVLIERSAPGHAALHRLAPYFTRAVALEAGETAAGHTQARPQRLVDYYAFLGVSPDATEVEISLAYRAKLHATAQVGAEAERARRALSILTDPARREAYDARLQAGRPQTHPRCEAPGTRATAAPKSEATAPPLLRVPARRPAINNRLAPGAEEPRRWSSPAWASCWCSAPLAGGRPASVPPRRAARAPPASPTAETHCPPPSYQNSSRRRLPLPSPQTAGRPSTWPSAATPAATSPTPSR